MKRSVLWLLPLFCGACTDAGESPVITVEKLYIKTVANEGAERVDYASRIEDLPVLKEGDEVEAILHLDGNGADLKTFSLMNDRELVVKPLLFDKSEISTEGNLTNESKGQYRFKDGVRQSQVMVRAVIEESEKEEVKLSFYLSSKAECEGDEEEIEFQLQQED